MRRLTHTPARLAIAGALALAGSGAALPGTALADPPGGPAAGHVYLDANTAGANTIAGFTRHSDGP